MSTKDEVAVLNGIESQTLRSAALVRALTTPECYPHPVRSVEMLETHISWVLLTGQYAYKIKKPVNLGFLDFSTLENRRFYCYEELRLNRRLAPEVYLDVVPIGGTLERPRLEANECTLDYAVKMVQFSQEARLDRVLERGEFTDALCDSLADEIADFHDKAPVAPRATPYGSYETVCEAVDDNYRSIASRLGQTTQFAGLFRWSQEEHSRRKRAFQQRKAQGFIRECHGDLHLENLVQLGNRIALFDCIEFNEPFRWIDVMNDLAFALMDMTFRGSSRFSHRLLNSYLEKTGDYIGLNVLRYYLVYRAMVRALIVCIRAFEPGLSTESKPSLLERFGQYVDLAASYTREQKRLLIITHGLSGSGKTTYTQNLLEELGAIRVRSDVERKRLFWRGARLSGLPGDPTERYSTTATQRTYGKLADLARTILQAGSSVVVDATNLKHWQRQLFREVANKQGVPLVTLDFEAPKDLLRHRIEQRETFGKDASEATIAVLEQQIRSCEPLTASEHAGCIPVQSDIPLPCKTLIAQMLRVEQ